LTKWQRVSLPITRRLSRTVSAIHERGDAPPREQETAGCRDECEAHAFGEELSHDAPASGAERRANRHLPRARRAAGQQQVGHVAAGDQLDQHDGCEQHKEALSEIADETLHERRRTEVHRGVVPGKIAAQPVRGGVELRLRLAERSSRFQPAVDGQVVLVVQRTLRGRERNRRPQLLAVGREIEGRRHHTGDLIADAVHPDRAANDGGARVEAPDPQSVAQHDDAIAAGPVFVDRKRASERRADTHHVEIVRGDARGDDAFGRGRVGHVVVGVCERGQTAVEARDRGVRIDVVADRHHLRLAVIDLADEHEARRIH
jgi:hypothetical protein